VAHPSLLRELRGLPLLHRWSRPAVSHLATLSMPTAR
jgi:hypothetical protein